MITHKARFNTKAYTAALRQAADLLEQIDTMNSYVSGNGTDTVLECQARIATSEPENPLYDGAVGTDVFNIRGSSQYLRRLTG